LTRSINKDIKEAINMNTYTLYVKTHNKTGLKYLGQTSRDAFTYAGSGVDWLKHLEMFGNDVETEIIVQTDSREERNQWGRYYSKLWNIVNGADDYGNKIWANKMPETGGGPGRTSESARTQALSAINDGTHIFVRDNPSPKRVADNTHNFIGGEIQKKMVADGTHHLLSGEIQKLANAKRIADGTHNWQGKEHNQRMIDNGTHNFLGSSQNKKMLADGSHPSQIKMTCEHCNKTVSKAMFARWHSDNCKNKKG
jgi:hypothetical protein